MVRALHQAGIEVILDVVFNHTCEGNELGPTLSFKGLENRVYYMLEQRRQLLPQLLGLRQHGQRQSSDRPRADLPLPAALGAELPRRRLPLRPGQHPQPQPQRRAGAQSAAGRDDRRRSAAGRHQDHRRSLGRRRGLSGRLVRQPALGGMERPLSRRRAPLLARRSAHDRLSGHAAGRLERPVRTERPASVPQHQLHHLARRLHAQRPGRATSDKHNEANGEEQPRRRQQQLQRQLRRGRSDQPGRRSRSCGCGRSRTCWPR